MAKIKQHSFDGKIVTGKKSRGIPYPVCTKCGMILLKNEASRKEATKPCPGSDD